MIPALSVVGSLFGTSPLAQAAPAASSESKSAGVPNANFADVFNQVGDVINNLKAGEAAAISGLQGQMPVHNVVESIMSAQRTLQTAIAVRDKIVSAYQSISQMPI